MKKIISASEKYILTTDNSLRIHRKKDLELIAEYPKEGVGACFIHDPWLFIAESRTVTALKIPDGSPAVEPLKIEERKEVIKCKSRVTVLFVHGSFLCIGTENGNIHILAFNNTSFREVQEYSHEVPVTDIVTDGAVVYVTDHRDRVTEYPSGRSYDFESPKIFYGKYLYCVEKKRIYTRTKEAFGLLMETKCCIDDLFFSDLFGYIFIRGGSKTICIDGSTGEEHSEYSIGPAVFADNALVGYLSGRFEVMDLFFPDLRMEEIKFKPTKIAEKKITADEYEKKYLFVDDGNKKGLAKTSKPRVVFENDSVSARREKQSSRFLIDDDYEENRTNKRKDKRDVGVGVDESPGVVASTIPSMAPVAFLPPLLAYNPSSYNALNSIPSPYGTSASNQSPAHKQNQANLLFYSTEGYMLSIESPISNFITIKYHDHLEMPIEIKDGNKCKIGSFYQRKFVLSNHELINFNDEWTKEIKATLIGMNQSAIFIFDENLKILNFAGEILHEIFLVDFYTFCVSPSRLAVFSRDNLLLIENINEADEAGFGRCITYVPMRDVSFSTFHENVLYLEIKKVLYKYTNGLLRRQCNIEGRPLAISDNFVLTLAEPVVLLPKPFINYYEITKAERPPVEMMKEHVVENSSKYNIYKKQ